MTATGARYLRPPESLRAKATEGLDHVAGIDPAGVAAAEAVLAARAERYPASALADVEQLRRSLAGARNHPAERVRALRAIAATAHAMRCHGSTFGFPLVTKVALSLYDYARKAAGSDEHLEIIEAHVDALRVILAERLTGDGGPVGKEVTYSLRQVVDSVPAERRR